MKQWMFAAILCAMLPASRVFAHATPVSYEPPASSILETAPTEILIRYTERLEPRASSVTLFSPAGEKLAATFSVDLVDPYLLRATMPSAGTGTYAVSWLVVSADDGHVTKGAFTFSVGVASAADGAGFSIEHRTPWRESLALWIELVGQALLTGGAALMLWWSKRLRRPLPAGAVSLLAFGAVLSVMGALLYLSLQTIALQEQSPDFLSALRAYLTTAAGQGAASRSLLSLLILITIATLRRRMLGNPGLILIIIATIVLAWLRASVSHAAASPFLPMFSIMVNAVHLLAKNLWIGACIAFAIIFLPVISGRPAREVAAGFLTLARLLTWAFAVGGATGAYVVWLHLKAPGNLVDTHWGMLCLTLASFGALLFVLRLYQHQVLLPLLARATQDDAIGKSETVRSLRFPVMLEVAAGLAVLFASSVLILTTPPVSGVLFSQCVESSDTSMCLKRHPGESETLLLEIVGSDIAADAVTVTLTNDAVGIGPVVASRNQRFPGGFALDASSFVPPGVWKIDVSVLRPGSYDAVGSFLVRVPEDLLPPSSSSRQFDLFAGVMFLVALLCIAWAFLLHRSIRRLEATLVAEGSPIVIPAAQAWAAIAISLLLFPALWYLFANHGHGGFQQACVQNGHAWQESVPMKRGKVLDSSSRLGCTIGIGRGQSHFVLPREYAEFLRPVQARAFLGFSQVPQAGEPLELGVTIVDSSGATVRGLSIEHERPLHVVIVGADLETFLHVHPVSIDIPDGAQFRVPVTFPSAGQYAVTVSYTVRAQSNEQQFAVQVEGAPAMAEVSARDGTLEQTQEGITVALDTNGPLTVGTWEKLAYTFRDASGDVLDLQPYLGAPMHVAVVRADLRHLIHAHGVLPRAWWRSLTEGSLPPSVHPHVSLPAAFGPRIEVPLSFPTPGRYVIFSEYQRNGRVGIARFEVTVGEP